MKRREFVARAGAGLAGALLPPLLRLRRERFVERWSWAMGQPVHVMLFAESEDQGLTACAQALAELRRIEARLSLFDDASELCELNRRAGRRSLQASNDLLCVASTADGYRRETEGAFNAAVEPLMRVWGFHRPRRTMPSPIELAAARRSVTTATVDFAGSRSVALPNAHTRLDLGGIAVGYGLDRTWQVLLNAGIRRAFVDVSGDCYGLGAPPDQPEGWAVRIAGSSRVVRLRDEALATSSNRASVIELERHILGHVMDPATGAPVDTRRQATVVARSAMRADALSTASLVSGRSYTASATYFTE
jgi:thiamine biosynthesis lipoprotein